MVVWMRSISRTLIRLSIVSLLGGALGAQQDAATPQPQWDVTWHLRKEFGVGHRGQTMFVVPDGSGGIWTNSTTHWGSQLWHLSGEGWVSPLIIGTETAARGGGRSAASRQKALRGFLDAARTPDGRLWAASSEGLFEIDGATTTLHLTVRPATGLASCYLWEGGGPPLITRPTSLVAVDGYGEVWAYGSRMGLLRRISLDATGRHGVWLAETHYVPGKGTRFQDVLEGDAVTAIAAPIKGEVIIGTASGELLFFKQEPYDTRTWLTLTGRVTAPATRGPANDIMRDIQGRLWCAYGGAYVGDAEFSGTVAMRDQGKWRIWNSENSRLPPRPVLSVCEVDLGVIWAGVDWHDGYVGGDPPRTTALLQLTGDDWEYVNPPTFWDHPTPVAGKKPEIYNECTRRICLIRTDDKGRVWVGSHGGLARFTHL